MAAPPIDPPSVPDEPPSKKQKLPKGIVPHRTEKFQARLSWKEDGKTKQRWIPGLFETVDAAVAAQAAAQQKFDKAGPEAVWATAEPGERNRRGEGLKRAQIAAEKKAAEKPLASAHSSKDAPCSERRDPKLPTSVPMPSNVEDICDDGMRAMWEGTSGGEGKAVAGAPAVASNPPPAGGGPLPPADWVWLHDGDSIEVEVMNEESSAPLWHPATVTAVLVDGWFQARIAMPSDTWEDWFPWNEEGVEWWRVGACNE